MYENMINWVFVLAKWLWQIDLRFIFHILTIQLSFFINLCFFLGQRLLKKADFHLGQGVNTFFKIKAKLGELGEDKKHFSGVDRRYISMFGKLCYSICLVLCMTDGNYFTATLDGGLGYVMPLAEKTYRRLLMLQNVLVSQGAHIAGLNPKAYR